MPADNKDKVTILKLRKQKQNNVKTVGVTAYDYPQALSMYMQMQRSWTMQSEPHLIMMDLSCARSFVKNGKRLCPRCKDERTQTEQLAHRL